MTFDHVEDKKLAAALRGEAPITALELGNALSEASIALMGDALNEAVPEEVFAAREEALSLAILAYEEECDMVALDQLRRFWSI